jgi:ribosome biogenesis GTPase
MGKPRKAPRQNNLTDRYLGGDFKPDDEESDQRFSKRSSNAQHNKIGKTAAMRALRPADVADCDALPVGEVLQVYSLYCDVEHAGKQILCVVRKTLAKVSATAVLVGDRVRFREVTSGTVEELIDLPPSGVDAVSPKGVIERIEPRKTLLTRSDSFRASAQRPMVANATQMLIVASLLQPPVKWGLVDRMILAARGGGLRPIICLNKVDLADAPAGAQADESAKQALAHYRTLGVASLRTSVAAARGLDELRDLLRDQSTVLAGHSGVGKSSLIGAIEPALDLHVGDVNRYTGKGRHTTTSARRYPLSLGGSLIDTPGVRSFGLWGVTPDNLTDFFPDVADGSAPSWRVESYAKLSEELKAARNP